MVNKTKEIIGEDNITEYIEPSAGNGVFLDYLPRGTLAYDIEPENERITKQDYLTLDLEYKKGRCIIGNPPYGRTGKGSVRFFNKSVLLSDYIAFILPITQLNNNYDFYKFDFIHSEDLGMHHYSNRDLHCCLNIYKRNFSGQLNKREIHELKDIEIRDYQRTRVTTHKRTTKIEFNYDIRICGYGIGTIGKEVEFEGQYIREICIRIKNKDVESKVLNLIKNINWSSIFKGTSGQIVIAKWRLYKYIKEQIPEIE